MNHAQIVQVMKNFKQFSSDKDLDDIWFLKHAVGIQAGIQIKVLT